MNYTPAFIYKLAIIEVFDAGRVTCYCPDPNAGPIMVTNNNCFIDYGFDDKGFWVYDRTIEAMYYKEDLWVVGSKVMRIVTCKTLAIKNNTVHLFQ